MKENRIAMDVKQYTVAHMKTRYHMKLPEKPTPGKNIATKISVASAKYGISLTIAAST